MSRPVNFARIREIFPGGAQFLRNGPGWDGRQLVPANNGRYMDGGLMVQQLLANAIRNGDLSAGTQFWDNLIGATVSASGRILSVAGNGTNSIPRVMPNMPAIPTDGLPRVVYACIRARVLAAGATNMQLRLVSTSGSHLPTFKTLSNPVANQWYSLEGIVTITDPLGTARLYIAHTYSDSASANAKIMEIDCDPSTGGGVFVADLTALGLEGLTVAQCDQLFTPWFDGTKATETLTVPTYRAPLAGEQPTNLLTENQSNGGEDGTLTGWGATGTGASISRDTTVALQGSSSIKVTRSSASASGAIISPTHLVPVKPGDVIVGSAFLFGSSGSVGISLVERAADGTTTVRLNNGTPITMDGTWKRGSHSITVGDGVAFVALYARSAVEGDFNVDCAMVERGSTPGSWVPGGMVRLLDATGGEIEVSCNITDVVKRTGGQQNIFAAPRLNSADAGIRVYNDGTGFMLETSNDAGVVSTSNAIPNANVPNGIRRFKVVWTAASATLTVDDGNAQTINTPNLPSAFAERLQLGHRADGTRYANCSFVGASSKDRNGNLTATLDFTKPHIQRVVGVVGS